jgi:hypothetical protein
MCSVFDRREVFSFHPASTASELGGCLIAAPALELQQ